MNTQSNGFKFPKIIDKNADLLMALPLFLLFSQLNTVRCAFFCYVEVEQKGVGVTEKEKNYLLLHCACSIAH